MSSPVVDERPSRPRAKSGAFSFKSDKTISSHGSKNTKALAGGRETHEEKQRLHLSISGKANPNAAMNEDQPVAAALQAATIASLRSIQHVDTFGNPISEPDLSNPTRPRWERPLDTIRSFEAAIDGEYKRRSAAQPRPNTAMFSDNGAGYQSRRNSYYGASDQYQQPRHSRAPSSHGGYYGQNRDSYYENQGQGQGYGYAPQSPPGRMRHDRRQYSEPAIRHIAGEAVYPSPGYQRSRDTVNTGVSNGSQSQSEPWANHTDPSSENSSVDRINAAPKPDTGEQHGFNGFGGTPFNKPIQEETALYNENVPLRNGPGNGYYDGYNNNQQSQMGGPPQPPPHAYPGNQPPQSFPGNQPPRTRNTLMKLGNSGAPPVPTKDGAQVTARPALQSTPSEKKKSWLKRRFSKD